MLSYPQPWMDAWVESTYGADGFWRNSCPHEHFRTASATGSQLAAAVLAVIPEQVRTVIDVGAGSGELLTALAGHRSDLRLTGIDLRARPPELPDQVDWVVDLWDARYHTWTTGAATPLLTGLDEPVLVVAAEWLDDLPCPVVQAGSAGWHEVVLDEFGAEHLGGRLSDDLRTWADTWWPRGDRAEIGLSRDRAWSHLLLALQPHGGGALLIDYGHELSDRPEHGSLSGYREGRQVAARPGVDLNLTAHVAVDALRAAGEAAGATTTVYGRQADVLATLVAEQDHADPIADLVHRSQRSALGAESGWGDFWWLLQSFPPSSD